MNDLLPDKHSPALIILAPPNISEGIGSPKVPTGHDLISKAVATN